MAHHVLLGVRLLLLCYLWQLPWEANSSGSVTSWYPGTSLLQQQHLAPTRVTPTQTPFSPLCSQLWSSQGKLPVSGEVKVSTALSWHLQKLPVIHIGMWDQAGMWAELDGSGPWPRMGGLNPPQGVHCARPAPQLYWH